jgi:hypothetical protein
LNDKTKEKEMADEINNKYGTDKGSMGTVIRKINEPTTTFLTKLMA